MSNATPKLFQPIKVGNLTLSHRLVLPPMTRMRCSDDHVLLPYVKDYYAQRATTPGTLLISEVAQISPAAGGMANTPGIHNEAQIKAWREIADAVHARGSYIFMQIRAMGAGAIPEVLKAEGNPYVAASAIKSPDKDETPRPLTKAEIKQYVEWFGQAAKNAIEAGVDGVEVHGANGYLIDQFLQDVTNVRSDEYGGSIENRSRFGLEVVDAVVKAIGAEHTAIRLSPWSEMSGMGMADPVPQFSHFVSQLVARHPALAYVHVVEARVNGYMTVPPEEYDPRKSNDFIRKLWAPRPLISCGAYSRELALEIAKKKGDLIAVGRPWISNPDLVERWRNNWALTPYRREFFYDHVAGTTGYTDYDFVTEEQKAKASGSAKP
ncbi:hypothetical protein FB107DRAFT_220310 [Schizophyllum commune]